MKNLERFGLPIFIIVMAILPYLLDDRWQAVAITFLVFTVVALSQDIILGKCGMFHMGQGLFFGMGAYVTAILNNEFGWPILATIPLAILIPALFGILLAGPIVHLRGDYLLVTTIGFNIVFVQVVQNSLDSLSLFGTELMSQISVYYFAFAVLLFTFWIMRNLEHSKAGRALHYLREDQLAAESIGINTRVYKIFAFGLGAGLAGLAGTVFAVQYSAVSPEAFDFIQSVLFFSIVIVGGSSIPGVLLGVFVMFVLPEIFREFATWRYFIFGFAMIAAMILRPRGIVPATFGKIPKFLIKGGSHDA
jgi:branched-chain amino acid transport system permease protein